MLSDFFLLLSATDKITVKLIIESDYTIELILVIVNEGLKKIVLLLFLILATYFLFHFLSSLISFSTRLNESIEHKFALIFV